MELAWIKKLSGLAKMKGIPLSFEKDQVLFYEGHQPFGIFLIRDGGIRLIQQIKGGKKRIMEGSTEEDIIGLEDILAKRPYSYTAISSRESHVVFISRPQVEEWLKAESPSHIRLKRPAEAERARQG